MAGAKPVCQGCGGTRDRGPYTKLCTSCFIKPCRRCGKDNSRGPYTVLCPECKDLPPKEDRTKCKKCGQPNDRGGRTTICTVCRDADSLLSKKADNKLRKSEAPRGKSWCGECESYKPHDQFYAKSENCCIECRATKQRAGHLERKYGLTEEQYAELFKAQNGRCAICTNAPKKQRLHVDHNHATGQVRGLLCLWCNHRLLGGARENPDILRTAARYLEDPPAVHSVGVVLAPPGDKKKAQTKVRYRSR